MGGGSKRELKKSESQRYRTRPLHAPESAVWYQRKAGGESGLWRGYHFGVIGRSKGFILVPIPHLSSADSMIETGMVIAHGIPLECYIRAFPALPVGFEELKGRTSRTRDMAQFIFNSCIDTLYSFLRCICNIPTEHNAISV